MEDPAPPCTNLKSLGVDEILQAQIHDQFFPAIRPKLNEGRDAAFEIDDDGILVRTGDKGIQIVVLHSLKDQILHINHHTILAGHTGGRKLYNRIRKDSYWQAL